MSKKLHLFFALLLAFSMLLSACARQLLRKRLLLRLRLSQSCCDEAPVLDVSAVLSDFWASLPADTGFGVVGAAKLSEELADKRPSCLMCASLPNSRRTVTSRAGQYPDP